jgi:hypothetical protein
VKLLLQMLQLLAGRNYWVMGGMAGGHGGLLGRTIKV